MNIAHIRGKKMNRLRRCEKRLADKELVSVQRNMISNRLSELKQELGIK